MEKQHAISERGGRCPLFNCGPLEELAERLDVYLSGGGIA